MRIPFLTYVDEMTLRRYLITGVAVLIAVLLGWALWWHYLRSPWTRDGRVRVEVVNIAAEIPGKVIHLKVVDNQQVKKGDILLEIEPVDFRLTLAQAEATVQSREHDRDIAHHTDCNVYIGRSLGETLARDCYVIGAGKQTVNAKLSAIVCICLAGAGRSDRLDDNPGTRDSRTAGVLDFSSKRAVRILCIHIRGSERYGRECE